MGTTGYKVRYSASGWSYVTADGAPVDGAPQPSLDRFPMTTPSPWPRRILMATVAAAAVIAVTAVALVYSIGGGGDDAAQSIAERSTGAAPANEATQSLATATTQDRQGLAGSETNAPANWEAVLKPEAAQTPTPLMADETPAAPSADGRAMASVQAETASEAEIAAAPATPEPLAAEPDAQASAMVDETVVVEPEPAAEGAAATTDSGAATRSSTSGEDATASATAALATPPVPAPSVRPTPPAGSNTSAATAAVPRMQLTSGMRGLEPADRLSSPIMLNGTAPRRLHLFSEMNNLNGQTVYHVWEYEGRDQAIIPLKIGAERWRAHSNKRIGASQTGQWRVIVRDASGRELSTASFVVQ